MDAMDTTKTTAEVDKIPILLDNMINCIEQVTDEQFEVAMLKTLQKIQNNTVSLSLS